MPPFQVHFRIHMTLCWDWRLELRVFLVGYLWGKLSRFFFFYFFCFIGEDAEVLSLTGERGGGMLLLFSFFFFFFFHFFFFFCLLPHPGSATGHLIAPGDHHTLQLIQVHFGVDFQADFEDVRWHDVALTWNHTKDHNRSRKLCFHHPGHVPFIRGNPDLYFEGAGNGPVVITWIGREHELYSGASPISLVEHCVTFRHDRRLLSLLGFVHNWPTSRWSVTKKEKKRKRKPVFIKRKWNPVFFSRATILSFHPVHTWVDLEKQYFPYSYNEYFHVLQPHYKVRYLRKSVKSMKNSLVSYKVKFINTNRCTCFIANLSNFTPCIS